MIEPSGVVKTGPYTVQFRLKAPNNAFPFLVSQTTYQAIIQPAAIAAQAGHLGVERNDRDRPVPPEEPEQAARRARPHQQLLGGQAPARRSRDHVLFRPRADGARACERGSSTSSCRCRRSRLERSRTTASTRRTPCRSPRTTCSGCGSIATRSATPACVERSRSRSTVRTSSTASSSAQARSGTTRRSSRDSHRPTRRSTSASRTSSSRRRC